MSATAMLLRPSANAAGGTRLSAETPARPALLVTLWAATAVYLLVELSFNARLLDVVGGSATNAEIDAIEGWGRLISGFALALLGWPRCITYAWRRFLNPIARLGCVALWTVMAIATMYAAQEALIRTLVQRADRDELTRAQHLMLLRAGVDRGVVELPGLDVGRERLEAADGKAFLAVFPLMGSGLGALVGEQFGDTQRAAVTRRLALRTLGDPNTHLARYSDTVRGLEEAWVEYDRSLQEIDAEGRKAWRRYVRNLRSKGMSPSSVKRRHYSTVRSRVRGMGVPVGDDWRPGDRAGFLEAATADAKRRARQTFAAELERRSPAFKGIEPPDTLVQFLHDPATQPYLLNALGYQCIRTFDADMKTAQDFHARVYSAEVECQVARRASEEGEPGPGREAMRALLVPLIALAMSLLGALTHIGKLALLSDRLVRGRDRPNARALYRLVFAGPLGAMLLFAWVPLSEITDARLYRSLERQLTYPLAMVVRGTIHGQYVGYPVFEAARVHLLRGFDFGYSAEPEPASGAATDVAPATPL